MPTITDKFNKTGDDTGAYPVVATVASARTAGDSVLTCNALTGWTTETPVHFTTYRLTSDGTPDRTTQTDWKGIVSGSTITEVARVAGAEDSGHLAGDIVELTPNIGWANDLMDGLLVSHNANGSLKDGIVGSSTVSDGSILTRHLADDSVEASKMGSTVPTFATEILQSYGAISSSTSKIMPATGFLVGKAISVAAAGKAMICYQDSEDYMLAGLPYIGTGEYIQVGFCVPVVKGQKLYFRCANSAKFEQVRLLGAQWG